MNEPSVFLKAGYLYKHQKVKLIDVVNKEDKFIYYFNVNGYDVKLEHYEFKEHTFKMNWNCTCQHSSLKGVCYDIWCCHIYAAITYLSILYGFEKTKFSKKVKLIEGAPTPSV